jgi:hypothetical protein
MAAKESVLTGALGTAPAPSESDPLGLVEKLGKKEDPMARGRFAYEQSPALLRGKSETEGDVLRRESQVKQDELRRGAEAERSYATEARKQYGEYEAGLKAPGEFQVPEYTASDYAKGAAQRLVSAFLIGGITKQSAKSQLQMIKSMQDAEDQGLDTEFQAARMKFDEAEKAKDKHNKRLKERFDSLMDLASKDRNAAMAEAKLIEADVGEGLIAAKIRSGQWAEAYKLFNNAMSNMDKLKLEQIKVGSKQASAPDRRLKPGERWNEEKGVIEAIVGSDIYKKQKQKFSEEYKDANSVIDQTVNGIKKIDEILKPENAQGFASNFGGYTAYGTQYLSGPASDMRKKIDSFKSDMKAAGKQLLAAGGSIGQITEREWPILQNMIASIDPVLSEDEARRTFDDIKIRFNRLIARTRDVYDTQFSDSQFYVPLGQPGAAPGRGTNMNEQDQQALNWANANPDDPRSAEIKKRLGVQ